MIIDDILKAIVAAGGRPYYAGGYVRDHVLGHESRDRDVEVYGLPADVLGNLLLAYGEVEDVGKAFGVFKMRIEQEPGVPALVYDFALPRTESKSGEGHKGFDIRSDPFLTEPAACARRDFTINAMLMHPFSERVVDYYGGQQDLENHVLRATSEAFADDPLRPLRGMQLSARFDLVAEKQTLRLCRSLLGEYASLPRERVWVEWQKWAEQGSYPSRGLEFLLDSKWIYLYAELAALLSCPQDPEWHPEGNAFVHTLYVCDYMVEICEREHLSGEDRVVLMFAALLHDVGKPSTTETDAKDGRIRAKGHEAVSATLAGYFLSSIGAPESVTRRVIPLIDHHMFHINTISVKSVRRLANKIVPATMTELGWLVEADASGRPPRPMGMPVTMQIAMEMAKDLQVEHKGPEPLVMGRHLIEIGVAPGKDMGKALKAAFEAQLDGQFETVGDGVNWILDHHRLEWNPLTHPLG